MEKGSIKPTRGDGMLECFLAKKRAGVACKLIPTEFRSGRLLDVGCGTFPYFLEMIDFREKYGVDRVITKNRAQDISSSLINFDLENENLLPFNDGYFDVVTMLAVLEHLQPLNVSHIVEECRRVLKSNGLLIITTPASWTEKLLKMMAALKLISPEEIDEHKDVYNHTKIGSLLSGAGFRQERMRFGYFELYMNLWAMAAK